ncbi:MAG TPA: type IV pilus secretin PilQ [Chondromyces sp.]|nr:type IV pilus secretin PilQ [Chondromyces sp.]
MMMKNVRSLVATAACVLLGASVPLLAEESIPVVQGMGAEAGSSGPVLHLRATGEMETVHYSPQPGVWVVELPEARWDASVGLLAEPALGIERAELDHVEEFGKRVSRLTVWLAEPAQLTLSSRPGGLELEFFSFADAPPTADRVSREEVVVAERRAAPPVAPAPGGTARLYEVVPVASGDGVVVELKADRALTVSAFTLPEPRRLVLDLAGVINHVERRLLPVNTALVSQVRVAQFQAQPQPVTRIVLDLRAEAEYRVDSTELGAVVRVGTSLPPRAASAAGSTQPAGASGIIEISRSEPAAEPEPAEQVASALFDLPDEQPPTDAAADRANAPGRSPWVADDKQLIESATAVQVLESPTRAGESYAATEVESQEEVWTGEPITLTLKDADVKDVLKTFSVLTDLNIVLDPGVSGSVTVELRQVPWDQALDLILKINGLDYVLENNVLRVAPINKLAAEKSAKAAFEKEREKAKPLSTYLKPLSYAKADYVAGLLSADSYLLSERGSVTVDQRTNTLILRDVSDRVEGILRLIDSLDLPTPQVVIEGRIVETTRDFSRELGVSWGFSGIMDAEHGNDTGLQFPNSIGVDGAVDLARGGNGVLAMTFGDILNTFNLDFLLSASEADGLVRIVSTPRVTTQNLQRASIRSGLQIPVQTVANNTVTVQYVDATLRLEVTPQITAEGTVNLDINIKKQEPVLAAAVEGGRNAPIFTRDAETQLLVRDGGTTVIAGIYQINDQDNENRVPGLHKIPIFGWMFKNKGVFKRHDELLIFITPRIVKY